MTLLNSTFVSKVVEFFGGTIFFGSLAPPLNNSVQQGSYFRNIFARMRLHAKMTGDRSESLNGVALSLGSGTRCRIECEPALRYVSLELQFPQLIFCGRHRMNSTFSLSYSLNAHLMIKRQAR